MAPLSTVAQHSDRISDGDFKDFCRDIFGTLGRVDQRRAGETYLYGLLNCPGRKSIRRMAAAGPGYHSEQSLQQFVNQSPWDHEAIRQRLMTLLMQWLKPSAWVVEEVAFPKHGRYSAAVERQYVRCLGKVCNCQLAVVVTMTCEQLSVPVNWRLVVPDSWNLDEERRARARLPEHEQSRPHWQYQIEMLDDMALDWGIPMAPVVVDARHLSTVESSLAALEDRNLPYLAQVSPNLGVGCVVEQTRPVSGALVSHPGPRAAWTGTVGELVRRMSNQTRVNVSWRDHDGDRSLRSQFLQIPIRTVRTEPTRAQPSLGTTERRLIVEWPLGKPQPRGYWVTNLTGDSLTDLVGLAKLGGQVGPRVERFAGQFGLRDYEGRTFAGWHHHVTLATAAYVFEALSQLRSEREDRPGAELVA